MALSSFFKSVQRQKDGQMDKKDKWTKRQLGGQMDEWMNVQMG